VTHPSCFRVVFLTNGNIIPVAWKMMSTASSNKKLGYNMKKHMNIFYVADFYYISAIRL